MGFWCNFLFGWLVSKMCSCNDKYDVALLRPLINVEKETSVGTMEKIGARLRLSGKGLTVSEEGKKEGQCRLEERASGWQGLSVTTGGMG